MKSIDELTKDDLLKILTVKLDDTIYYISKFNSISRHSLIYDNEEYSINNPVVFDALSERLLTYEMYKFFNVENKMNEILDKLLADKVENAYAQKMELIIDTYSQSIDSITKRLQHDTEGLETLSATLNANFDKFNSNLAQVAEHTANAIPERVTRNLNTLVNDLTTIKADVRKDLHQVTTEFDGVVGKLKTLFN